MLELGPRLSTLGISSCSSGESPCSLERINKEILPKARDFECRTKPSGEALFHWILVPAWILDFSLDSRIPFFMRRALAQASWADVSVLSLEETSRNRWGVQFSHSVVSNSLWPHGLQHAGSLSITSSQNLLKLMSIKLEMPSNHLILCCPLLLPSIFPSIRVFSNKSALCIRWPKYWSFSFSIRPSYKYSGLISFRINWFDLPAVQGSLKSFLQNYSSKASIFRCSVFFIVQLSHPYMTTGNKPSFDYWDLCQWSNVSVF